MAAKKQSLQWKLGVLLVIAAIVVIQYRESGGDFSSGPERAGRIEKKPAPEQAGVFETLDGCTLIKNRRNDGDSFWVKTSRGDFEFRLYFADAPESAAKTYRNGENNHKRLSQQGRALGGLSQKQTVEVGQRAKRFVSDVLQRGEFRVATRWESVYGSPRKYAFVIVRWDGEEKYLHELLVSRGLARIHTKPMRLPDGTSVGDQKRHLAGLEQKAKQKKLGAWGIK